MNSDGVVKMGPAEVYGGERPEILPSEEWGEGEGQGEGAPSDRRLAESSPPLTAEFMARVPHTCPIITTVGDLIPQRWGLCTKTV